jgi:hypothetical protein
MAMLMADRAGLSFVGAIFGGITAVVMLVAVAVVIGHAEAGSGSAPTPAPIVAAR